MTTSNDFDATGTVAYSETDASNTGTSPGLFPDGVAPSSVKTISRSLMGAAKRAWDRDHAGAWCTVGGTANAITLTYTVAPNSYVQGQKFAFKATAANTGATTVNVNALGAKNLYIRTASGAAACAGGEVEIGDLVEIEYDGTQFQLLTAPANQAFVVGNLSTKATPTTSDSVVIMDAAASNAAKTATIAHLLSGMVAQVVSSETGAVATGTTPIPFDDTIPQNTEGDQYLSLAITPTNASSTLIIDVEVTLSHSASGNNPMALALFQDTTANALAVAAANNSGSNSRLNLSLRHKMTAGTTSATTFKVRAGCNVAGTTTFNGNGGLREFGGVYASSITITEIRP